jgi:hypothetical protein
VYKLNALFQVFIELYFICSYCYDGECEDFCHMGCDAMYFDRFLRNISTNTKSFIFPLQEPYDKCDGSRLPQLSVTGECFNEFLQDNFLKVSVIT